ncbi:hypothetical protein Glove_60g28 [Diversispora epigaea]|uniref:Uncharacterized protein n=1 Tax=Diversispora epigaea TaxID=1348612 RepID=A0A397JDV7_9GLOM|nr:hypothetical protein Glove_60g28 [Diversispora epigaea]
MLIEKKINLWRCPNMFVAKYWETIFELMYVELCQTLKPDKDQFDIIGVQIAGNELHLNLLVRDMVNVHRYYHLQSAEIPVQFSDKRVIVMIDIVLKKLSQYNSKYTTISQQNFCTWCYLPDDLSGDTSTTIVICQERR